MINNSSVVLIILTSPIIIKSLKVDASFNIKENPLYKCYYEAIYDSFENNKIMNCNVLSVILNNLTNIH